MALKVTYLWNSGLLSCLRTIIIIFQIVLPFTRKHSFRVVKPTALLAPSPVTVYPLQEAKTRKKQGVLGESFFKCSDFSSETNF